MKSIFLSLSCEFLAVGTYLLLELEGDTSDGSLFDSLHEMGGETYTALDAKFYRV